MLDPKKLIEKSVMPAYPWMIEDDLDVSKLARKIRVMQKLGVPYPEGYDKIAIDDLIKQATEISNELKADGIECPPDKEIIAMIAYLHKLGRDISTVKSDEVDE